jgi:hypothetical protein
MRASHEGAVAWRAARHKKQEALREWKLAQGLVPPARATVANSVSPWQTADEERAAREDGFEAQWAVYRALLPQLVRRLRRIPDPRHPKLNRHQLTSVLLYGILAFVFQMASRREANRQMTMPVFRENLQRLCPELETAPHQDTLNRVLGAMAVDELEKTLLDLVDTLIRRKKFHRWLIGGAYPIAIDGTQKLVRNWCWMPECLERQVAATAADGGATTRPQYYVYVLEASFAFANGLTIPLMSEFLTDAEWDELRGKQDCETRAFMRLAARLKARFPRLPLLILLDGLYANGPVMALCRQYHWQFMIVLQNNSLPAVWEEARSIKGLEPQQQFEQTWGDRRQHFWWVNEIDYCYGPHERKRQRTHVVVCEERWQTLDRMSNQIVDKQARHAWVSSEPLTRVNIHQRCNLGGRHRWAIESQFLVEKRQGYAYEHLFSLNCRAMKGYHFLMRLGHLLNVLATHAVAFEPLVKQLGFRGLIRFLRETCSGPWLPGGWQQPVRTTPWQLRLV